MSEHLRQCIAFLILAGVVVADEREAADSFQPVAGGCILVLNPKEILAELESFGAVSGGERSLYWDLKKNIERRFSADDHLPFQKGRVLVASDRRLEILEFDFVADEAGAKASIEEFSGQWKAPEAVARPNYETKVEAAVNQCWVVSVSALSWVPKVPNDPKAEVKWERNEFWTHKYYFRLQNGFLWHSRSEDVLQKTDFSRIPARLLTPEAADSGRRVMTVWVDPNQIDLAHREKLLGELSRRIQPGMAAQDNEDKVKAVRRRTALFLQWLSLRALLIDCRESWLHMHITKEGSVLFVGDVKFEKDSTTSNWARAVGTSESSSLPKATDRSSIGFAARAALPYGPFLWTPESADEVPETAPVQLTGAVDILDDGSAGHLLLRLAAKPDLNARSFQLPMVLMTNFVAGMTGAQQQPQVVVDQESIEIHWGENFPEFGEPHKDQHAAKVEIVVQRSLLQTIRQRLGAGRTDVRQKDEADQGKPSESEAPSSSEELAVQVELQPESLSIRIGASKMTSYELLALLFDAGIRI